MRQMCAVSARVKAELYYTHTGEPSFIKQLCDILAKHAEILCNNRNVSHFFLYGVKKFHSGSLDPFAVFRRFFVRRNSPI